MDKFISSNFCAGAWPACVYDHVPFLIKIGTQLPKSNVFLFENYWINFPDFLATVELHWDSALFFANAAKILNGKVKQVRSGLTKMEQKPVQPE